MSSVAVKKLFYQSIVTGTPIRGTTHYTTRKPRQVRVNRCIGFDDNTNFMDGGLGVHYDCGVQIKLGQTRCMSCAIGYKLGRGIEIDFEHEDRKRR